MTDSDEVKRLNDELRKKKWELVGRTLELCGAMFTLGVWVYGAVLILNHQVFNGIVLVMLASIEGKVRHG